MLIVISTIDHLLKIKLIKRSIKIYTYQFSNKVDQKLLNKHIQDYNLEIIAPSQLLGKNNRVPHKITFKNH